MPAFEAELPQPAAVLPVPRGRLRAGIRCGLINVLPAPWGKGGVVVVAQLFCLHHHTTSFGTAQCARDGPIATLDTGSTLGTARHSVEAAHHSSQGTLHHGFPRYITPIG